MHGSALHNCGQTHCSRKPDRRSLFQLSSAMIGDQDPVNASFCGQDSVLRDMNACHNDDDVQWRDSTHLDALDAFDDDR